MFRGNYRLTDPGETEATLSITMTLKEWEKLKEQLVSDYPSWHLSVLIRRLIDLGTQEFRDTHGEEA